MKAGLLFGLMLMFSGLSGYAQSSEGKDIFAGNCKACHSIGGGDIIGPDLAGVTDRRDAEWIKNFITNSQKMVNEGDAQAVKVFNKYKKIAMPSHNFSKDQLNSLVNYMEEAGNEASKPEEEASLETTHENTTDPTALTIAASESGPNFYVKVLLACLGIAAVLLSIMAAYLFRLLKS